MGRMTSFAQSERAALCDTFDEVGPEAPTLCGTWTTRDLAAHLVLRERRPDASLGMFVPPLAGHLKKVQQSIADKPWAHVIDLIRQGPPRVSLFGLPGVDARANLGEFFIHHEDVLRAAPDWTRRTYDEGLEKALFGALSQLSLLASRHVQVGLVADCPGVGRRRIHKPRGSHGSVVLTGAPSEVLLLIAGRGEVAEVETDGAAADLAEFSPDDFQL